MKIKTGARILALSALTTMMFSASALAKIEEGKLLDNALPYSESYYWLL